MSCLVSYLVQYLRLPRFTTLIGILTILLSSLTASAQSRADPSASPFCRLLAHSFSFDGEPLLDALLQAAQRCDISLIVSNDLVENVEAPSLTGRFTIDEAVSMLLRDTGLSRVWSSDRHLVILAEPDLGIERPGEAADPVPERIETGALLGELRRVASNVLIEDAQICLEGPVSRCADTDVSGRFSMDDLPAGDYELQAHTSRDGSLHESISIVAGSEQFASLRVGLEPVIVTGYARAMRDARLEKWGGRDISDVLTVTEIGELYNANLSEALSRLPGVNAVRNQVTGEGDRLTVRGISSEYNLYTINGISLDGTGSQRDNFFRGLRTSFLSPEGIEKITVHKTLLPYMDLSALGGGIDVQTPSALDYDNKMMRGSVARQWFGDEGQTTGWAVSGAMSRRLSENFGVYASGFYDVSRPQFEQVGDNGDRLPARWYDDPLSVEGWDYDQFHLRGWELSAGQSEVERWGINGALNFSTGSHDFHMRVQSNDYLQDSESNSLQLRNITGDRSYRFRQVDPAFRGLTAPETWTVTGESPGKGRIYGENITPDVIVDADGDGIITDADATCKSFYSVCGSSGLYAPRDLRIDRELVAQRTRGRLNSVNIGGESIYGDLTLAYDLAYSQSQDDIERNHGLTFGIDTRVSDQTGLWLGNDGATIRGEHEKYPFFELNPAGLDAVQNSAQFMFKRADIYSSSVLSDSFQAQWRLSYDAPNAFLNRIDYGGNFQTSSLSRERYKLNASPALLAGTSMSDLSAFYGDDVSGLFGGRYVGSQRLGQTLDAERIVSALDIDFSSLSPDVLHGFDYEERILALYALADLQLNQTQVLIGGRAELQSYSSRAPVEFVILNAESQPLPPDWTRSPDLFARNDHILFLPSVHINHVFGVDLIGRAAAWTSYAKPSIERTTRAARLVLDARDSETGNQIENPENWVLREANTGNYELSPARAYNLDLSLEWYPTETGAYSIALFYKNIDDFLVRGSSSVIRSGVSEFANSISIPSFENPIADDLLLTRPGSGESAQVWGVELSLRDRFLFLPAPFDHLGGSFNATWQKSQLETGVYWHPEGYKLPLFETPETLLNVELFWSSENWDAYLSYNYQGAFLEDFEEFGNNPYEQDYAFLDFSMKRFLADRRHYLSFDVQNILGGPSYWYTFGKNPSGSPRSYISNGPIFQIKLAFVG